MAPSLRGAVQRDPLLSDDRARCHSLITLCTSSHAVSAFAESPLAGSHYCAHRRASFNARRRPRLAGPGDAAAGSEPALHSAPAATES